MTSHQMIVVLLLLLIASLAVNFFLARSHYRRIKRNIERERRRYTR